MTIKENMIAEAIFAAMKPLRPPSQQIAPERTEKNGGILGWNAYSQSPEAKASAIGAYLAAQSLSGTLFRKIDGMARSSASNASMSGTRKPLATHGESAVFPLFFNADSIGSTY